MTRKKWNRLRRQRPELFGHLWQRGAWERLTKEDRNRVKEASKPSVIASLTAYRLTKDEAVSNL